MEPRSELTDNRTIWAWCMYDWANSAYVLTIATAVLPAYFSGGIVPEQGWCIFGTLYSATSLWGYTISLAALAVFLGAPVLGAMADASGHKKHYLALFCMTGAACALGLAFSGPGDVGRTLLLFMGAQICFACANVFYDAFLPEIAHPDDWDRVSAHGFAYGYLGGGLQFLVSLGLIAMHERLGLGLATASSLSMGMAALWWAGFSLIPLRRLPGARPNAPAPSPLIVQARQGLAQAGATLRIILHGGPASLFLLAFLLYNDGIQTTIAMATIYGKEELGLSTTILMLTLLVIQFVAFGGAELFARLARRIGPRNALLVSLAVWTGIVFYAYVIHSAVEYFILGALVGLVLGGSQALSRSLFARLIPPGRAAQYFGYFSVVAKLSAIGGPFLFALVRQTSGSSRTAILVIAIFFALGMGVLWRVKGTGMDTAAAGQKRNGHHP